MPSINDNTSAFAAVALLPLLDGRGTYLFYDLATETEFRAHRWTELPMPELIVERLNQLYDRDNPNKVGRNKRNKKSAIEATDVVVPETNDATQTVQNLVRVPTLRGEPDHPIVPDIIAAHVGVPSEEDATESVTGEENSQQPIHENDPDDQDVSESEFRVEDPADHLESLGHTTINGVTKSARISKKGKRLCADAGIVLVNQFA
jgi:hypothetical protein